MNNRIFVMTWCWYVLAAVLLVAVNSTSASAGFILIADDYLASNSPGFAGGGPGSFPENPPGPNQYWWSNCGMGGITNDFTWDMSATRDEGTEALSTFVPGLYTIELSWGAWPTHQTSISYTLDVDGFGSGSNTLGVDQFLLATGVDHSRLANGGSATGTPHWSDFLAVGTFNMPSASEIFMDAAPLDWISTTVVVLRLTSVPIPEPSSIVLAASGLVALAALAFRARRKRKKF